MNKDELLKEAQAIFTDLLNTDVPSRDWIYEMSSTLSAWVKDVDIALNDKQSIDDYLYRKDKL